MRAPTVRNLCTLSALFRSRITGKLNTKVETFIRPSPEFEVGYGSEPQHSSELDLGRDYSRGTLVKFQFLCLPMFSSILSFIEGYVSEFCVILS